MKSVLCTAGYLILAISLLMAGVPVYAMMDHSDTDRQTLVEFKSETDSSSKSGEGGCPHHAIKAATPDAQDQIPLSDSIAEECCGPDCRCSCAGLSLIPIPRFKAPQVPNPESSWPAQVNHLPSLAPAPLLRPPQIS
jgi:hypothetical protein